MPVVPEGGGSKAPFPNLQDLIPGWSELQSVKAFIAEASDYRMWRSLGWLVLGIMLLLTGLWLWLRIPQAGVRVIGEAAKAAI